MVGGNLGRWVTKGRRAAAQRSISSRGAGRAGAGVLSTSEPPRVESPRGMARGHIAFEALPVAQQGKQPQQQGQPQGQGRGAGLAKYPARVRQVARSSSRLRDNADQAPKSRPVASTASATARVAVGAGVAAGRALGTTQHAADRAARSLARSSRVLRRATSLQHTMGRRSRSRGAGSKQPQPQQPQPQPQQEAQRTGLLGGRRATIGALVFAAGGDGRAAAGHSDVAGRRRTSHRRSSVEALLTPVAQSPAATPAWGDADDAEDDAEDDATATGNHGEAVPGGEGPGGALPPTTAVYTQRAATAGAGTMGGTGQLRSKPSWRRRSGGGSKRPGTTVGYYGGSTGGGDGGLFNATTRRMPQPRMTAATFRRRHLRRRRKAPLPAQARGGRAAASGTTTTASGGRSGGGGGGQVAAASKLAAALLADASTVGGGGAGGPLVGATLHDSNSRHQQAKNRKVSGIVERALAAAQKLSNSPTTAFVLRDVLSPEHQQRATRHRRGSSSRQRQRLLWPASDDDGEAAVAAAAAAHVTPGPAGDVADVDADADAGDRADVAAAVARRAAERYASLQMSPEHGAAATAGRIGFATVSPVQTPEQQQREKQQQGQQQQQQQRGPQQRLWLSDGVVPNENNAVGFNRLSNANMHVNLISAQQPVYGSKLRSSLTSTGVGANDGDAADGQRPAVVAQTPPSPPSRRRPQRKARRRFTLMRADRVNQRTAQRSATVGAQLLSNGALLSKSASSPCAGGFVVRGGTDGGGDGRARVDPGFGAVGDENDAPGAYAAAAEGLPMLLA